MNIGINSEVILKDSSDGNGTYKFTKSDYWSVGIPVFGSLIIESGNFVGEQPKSTNCYIEPETGGNVTIKSGTFDNICFLIDGSLTIEGGEFSASAEEMMMSGMLYVRYGSLNVSGGKFFADSLACLLIDAFDNSDSILNGKVKLDNCFMESTISTITCEFEYITLPLGDPILTIYGGVYKSNVYALAIMSDHGNNGKVNIVEGLFETNSERGGAIELVNWSRDADVKTLLNGYEGEVYGNSDFTWTDTKVMVMDNKVTTDEGKFNRKTKTAKNSSVSESEGDSKIFTFLKAVAILGIVWVILMILISKAKK